MALMSVKNLVHNKLARQNIFFALLIQFRFLLFWLTVIIIYILILLIIIVTTDFIILLLLLYLTVIIVIIIIVLSLINVIYFILSHFISYCSYYYDFCLCVCVWRVCVPFPFSPLFLLMIYILYSHCLYMSKISFLQPLSFISSLSSSQQFYFFQHYQSFGENSANKYPYPLITLGEP